MMDPTTSAMQDLALWLLTQEAKTETPPEEEAHAMCRACEKLRQPLSTLAGAAGYRSLISRALTLAQRKAPALRGMEVKADGSLEWSTAIKHQDDTEEAARAKIVLMEQLLVLLTAFIGQALTLRLVRDVWPDAPFQVTNSETEKKP
jgi:hypothetical protein